MQDLELAREGKAAYMREWRKKNPDKVRANNQRYWANQALKRKEMQKRAAENEDN